MNAHDGLPPAEPATPDDFIARLHEAGVKTQVEYVDSELAPFTGNLRCVHCLIDCPGPRLYAGFHIQTGRGHAFLSLMSGHIYYVEDNERLVELTAKFAADCTAKRKTPWNVPEDWRREYRLAPFTILLAAPALQAEHRGQIAEVVTGEGFTVERAAEALRGVVDQCDIREDDALSLQRGETRAILQICTPIGGKTALLAVLLLGDWRGGAAETALLKAIQESLQCDLFEMSWGNKIQWDDPYYDVGERSADVDEPRNIPATYYESMESESEEWSWNYQPAWPAMGNESGPAN